MSGDGAQLLAGAATLGLGFGLYRLVELAGAWRRRDVHRRP